MNSLASGKVFAVFLTAISLILIGCGGGGNGGEGSGGTDNNNGNVVEPITLPVLSGLSGDANNQDRLFYFTSGDAGGLFSFNPNLPDASQLIDSKTLLSSQGLGFFFPIHKAEWDSATKDISGFRVDQVIYARKNGVNNPFEYLRVATDSGYLTADTVPLSSESSFYPIIGNPRFFQFDLSNPLNTRLAYPDEKNEWRQLSVGDDGATAPLLFDTNHQVVTTVSREGKPDGWLVIDTSNSNGTLTRVRLDLTTLGVPLDATDTEVRGLANVTPIGWEPGDGSQLLALQFKEDFVNGEPGPGELWWYDRGDLTSAGTLKRLLNAEGDSLILDPDLVGMGVSKPLDLAYLDGTWYALVSSGFLGIGGTSLYRIDNNGWEILASEEFISDFTGFISAGDWLVWAYNNILYSYNHSIGLLQTLINDEFVDAYSTPIFGSRDGWVFYNRNQFYFDGFVDEAQAVALKADNSDQIVISNARWVGASTSGQGTESQLGQMEVSEVFLLRNESELAAVSARQPASGAVSLGDLPLGAIDVRMFGLAPGPHRLLQVEHEDDLFEVIYVNTREADSLLQLMTEPEVNGSDNRPVDLF